MRVDFFHAYGEKATETLINKLNICGQEKIVEYGYGTGATLVKLKSRYPSIELVGIELSHDMAKTASERIRFCGLNDKIKLLHTSNKETIKKNSIDIVYVESVLAILQGSILHDTINYLNSILKKNGILVINESIWLKSITTKQIESINKRCKDNFGDIQCNIYFNSIHPTIKIFESFDFKNLSYERLRNNNLSLPVTITFKEKISKLFTLLGKLKLIYNLKLKKENKNYNTEMSKIYEPGKEYLTGVIMTFKKNNQSIYSKELL